MFKYKTRPLLFSRFYCFHKILVNISSTILFSTGPSTQGFFQRVDAVPNAATLEILLSPALNGNDALQCEFLRVRIQVTSASSGLDSTEEFDSLFEVSFTVGFLC